MIMKTIRSPNVADAPPQTWSNMKVANGYFHIAGMTGSGPKGEHPGDDMYIQESGRIASAQLALRRRKAGTSRTSSSMKFRAGVERPYGSRPCGAA
jgi:enamine deaminase RidA (YjgF/YER057c/UK114 family)